MQTERRTKGDKTSNKYTIKMTNCFVWTLAKTIKVFKRRASFILFIVAVIIFLFKWKLVCLNVQPRLHISQVCASFENGQSIGNLCQELCHSGKSAPISCHSFSSEKAIVFSGMWMNISAIFKSAKPLLNRGLSKSLDTSDHDFSMENDFVTMIRTVIKTKFNIFINDIDAKRMSYVQYSQVGGNRYTEMQNVWSLILDNEYLALTLYEKFDVFPKLLGTCGSLYAVEKLDSISGYWHLMTLYDSQEEWVKRVKISIMILDFLLILEEGLPEPMMICDVKMSHFGVANDFKKVKYLDLDSVHPLSIANKMTANGAHCKKHSDCDLSDCRSFCNLITSKCQNGVVNNNLQVVCERIFLGWVMSGRIMVPGLLFGPKAPAVLIDVLENCANPSNEIGVPRSPATKDIRNRLYKLLTHFLL